MAKYFNVPLTCGHCSNKAPMEQIGSVWDKKTDHYKNQPPIDSGDCFEVLKCPACGKNNIAVYFWADYMDSDDEVSIEVIYPKEESLPKGLPPNISTAYQAAEAVRNIDVNAYAILIRRILEMICNDNNATGKNLYEMVQNLSDRKEIPAKLVNVADGLRGFGNIGAHPREGNLSKNEIPILRSLCLALLEYLYSAPYLAQLAEEQLAKIKAAGSKRKKSSKP